MSTEDKEKIAGQAETEIKDKNVDQDQEKDSDDDEDEHHNDHEGCQDHDHGDGDDKKDGKKSNRGEKKFKKAMQKLGMKPVSGINRVTIKKGKSLLLYIDDPEVLKSPGADNSFIIFGEAKINDFAQNLAQSEAKQFQKPEKADKKGESGEKPAETVVEKKEDDQNLSEEGLQAESIKMVMDHCKCTKVEAIKALRESNGDSVNAILQMAGK